MKTTKHTIPAVIIISGGVLFCFSWQDFLYLFYNHGDLYDYTSRGFPNPAIHYIENTWERSMVALQETNVGRSEAEVEMLFGRPRAKAGPIALEGWPRVAAVSTANWLYEYGGTRLRLSFEHDKCIAVQTYDYILDLHWQEWWSDQIAAFSITRTQREILEYAGEPNSKQGPLKEWKGLESVEETWRYQTGYSTGVCLGFRNGICTKTVPFMTFH